MKYFKVSTLAAVTIVLAAALIDHQTAHAAVTVENVASNTGSGSSSYSFNATCTACTAIIVTTSGAAGQTVSSVTFNGIALTKKVDQAFTNEGRSTIWSLANPNTGTHSVSITLSGTGRLAASAVTFTGTDTTEPIGATASNTGTSGTASVSITTAYDNSIVMDTAGDYTGSTSFSSPGSGQTQQVLNNFDPDIAVSTQSVASHGNASMTWSVSGTSNGWQSVAVEVKGPVSGVAVEHTASNTGSGSSSYSFNTICTACTALVVNTSGAASQTVDSITFDGVSLTKTIDQTYPNEGRSTIWSLANPHTGTHSVTITLSATGRLAMSAITFTGTDLIHPIGATASNTGTSGTASVNITTTSGNSIVVDTAGDYTGSTSFSSPGSGQTQQVLNNFDPDIAVSTKAAATPGSTSLTWSVSSTSNGWQSVAVEIRPPTVEVENVASNTGSGSSTYSFNATCTACSVIYVTTSGAAAQTVSSITYNGVSLTKRADQAFTNEGRSTIWSLVNPSTGTHSVAITLNSTGRLAMSAITFTGTATSSDPTGATAANTGTGSTASVALTTAVDNSIILDTAGDFTGSTSFSSPGSGQTQQVLNNFDPDIAVSTKKMSNFGNTSMTWSVSNTSNGWQSVGVEVKPQI